jgi:hypothetical protein
MRKRRLLARVAAGALTGLAAGFVAGVAARIAMRMVADGHADQGARRLAEFTIEGTLGIVIFGMILGAPFGVIYDAIAERLPGPARLRGLVFGALCLATLGPLFFLGNPDEFFSQGRVLLFATLFPIVGVAFALAHAPSVRLATPLPTAAQALIAFVALAGGAFIAIGLLGIGLQTVGITPM